MQIAQYPNKSLLTQTSPISENEFGMPELKQLVTEMFELMQKAQGVGLAGNQVVGCNKRLFVMDAGNIKEAFINPVIVENSEEMVENSEGCLSVLGVQVLKKRHKCVTLKWKTVEGKEKINKFEGLPAICIGHEISHLEGKTIICDLSKLKRDILLKKSSKFVKEQEKLYALREILKKRRNK
ncbi:MAG: peptide deformylase [Nanoarchaeota archaeon]